MKSSNPLYPFNRFELVQSKQARIVHIGITVSG